MRRAPRANIDIDVQSFSDIAFLLIIFFILTTSLSRPMGRVLDMPSASKPDARKVEGGTPTVNLLADRILFGEGGEDEGREMTLSELRSELLGRHLASASESDRMVVVEIADDVAYDRYYRVVAMVSETGGIVAMMTE
ncbi:MAG: biopolymer transporter ExbD [Lentisphaerae bacterium]|jgi:biopolymer transport protein ExbD|nr:biopolymer transporter ExbD [Lentisphaerota bacterium]